MAGGSSESAGTPPLRDRDDAGARLAERLGRWRDRGAVVVGLPRGGVPIARILADRWGAPLDVLVVRKVGAPGHPEYALGAVAEGTDPFLDASRVREYGLQPRDLEGAVERAVREVDRLARTFRGRRPRLSLRGRPVLAVDDGVATGATVRVALRALRAAGADPVGLAVGVAPAETVAELRRWADDVEVALVPTRFFAVGEWYRDFAPVSDAEVVRCLEGRRPRP